MQCSEMFPCIESYHNPVAAYDKLKMYPKIYKDVFTPRNIPVVEVIKK